jgi:hypothetical protein
MLSKMIFGQEKRILEDKGVGIFSNDIGNH